MKLKSCFCGIELLIHVIKYMYAQLISASRKALGGICYEGHKNIWLIDLSWQPWDNEVIDDTALHMWQMMLKYKHHYVNIT